MTQLLTRQVSADWLARVEDAGLNASAAPQQLWFDGWWLRFSPGKAKRARCINAVAPGRRPVEAKVDECRAMYAERGLPLWFRLTPFTQPAGLEDRLEALDMVRQDDTRVMVCPSLAHLQPDALPSGVEARRLDAAAYAELIGGLRGSPAGQRQAQAQRVAMSPVPYEGWVIRRMDDGQVLACGQFAREGELVGLYDVFTPPEHRGRGWARWLCIELLSHAKLAGARAAYLQVEADNAPARKVYERLGFFDGYRYHYRVDDPFAA